MKQNIFTVCKILIVLVIGGLTFRQALENQKLSSEFSELRDAYGSVIVSDRKLIYISSANRNQSGGTETSLGHTKLTWQFYCPEGVAIRAAEFSCYPGETKGRNYSLGFVNGVLSDPAKTVTCDFLYRPYDVCRPYRGQINQFIKDYWDELERVTLSFDGKIPVDLSKPIVLFELRVPAHLREKFEAAIEEDVAVAGKKLNAINAFGRSKRNHDDEYHAKLEKQKQEALWLKYLLSTRPLYRFEIEKINAAMVSNRVVPRNQFIQRKNGFQAWLDSRQSESK